MGDWYPDPDDPLGWLHTDEDGPPGQSPAITHLMNAITPARAFAHEDGSMYVRVSATEFASYDQVDSRAIVDDGAPE